MYIRNIHGALHHSRVIYTTVYFTSTLGEIDSDEAREKGRAPTLTSAEAEAAARSGAVWLCCLPVALLCSALFAALLCSALRSGYSTVCFLPLAPSFCFSAFLLFFRRHSNRPQTRTSWHWKWVEIDSLGMIMIVIPYDDLKLKTKTQGDDNFNFVLQCTLSGEIIFWSLLLICIFFGLNNTLLLDYNVVFILFEQKLIWNSRYVYRFISLLRIYCRFYRSKNNTIV